MSVGETPEINMIKIFRENSSYISISDFRKNNSRGVYANFTRFVQLE